MCALLVEAQDALGDGIAVVVVVKEPAVKPGVAESRLDRFEIHTEIGYGNTARHPPCITELFRSLRNSWRRSPMAS